MLKAPDLTKSAFPIPQPGTGQLRAKSYAKSVFSILGFTQSLMKMLSPPKKRAEKCERRVLLFFSLNDKGHLDVELSIF